MYHPKALDQQARGIAVVGSAPYGCVYRGEVEGQDNSRGTRGATREMLRNGALNDARNNAVYVVGNNMRIVLFADPRRDTCLVRGGVVPIMCYDENKPEVQVLDVVSYRVHTQVYECGGR